MGTAQIEVGRGRGGGCMQIEFVSLQRMEEGLCEMRDGVSE